MIMRHSSSSSGLTFLVASWVHRGTQSRMRPPRRNKTYHLNHSNITLTLHAIQVSVTASITVFDFSLLRSLRTCKRECVQMLRTFYFFLSYELRREQLCEVRLFHAMGGRSSRGLLLTPRTSATFSCRLTRCSALCAYQRIIFGNHFHSVVDICVILAASTARNRSTNLSENARFPFTRGSFSRYKRTNRKIPRYCTSREIRFIG